MQFIIYYYLIFHQIISWHAFQCPQGRASYIHSITYLLEERGIVLFSSFFVLFLSLTSFPCIVPRDLLRERQAHFLLGFPVGKGWQGLRGATPVPRGPRWLPVTSDLVLLLHAPALRPPTCLRHCTSGPPVPSAPARCSCSSLSPELHPVSCHRHHITLLQYASVGRLSESPPCPWSRVPCFLKAPRPLSLPLPIA